MIVRKLFSALLVLTAGCLISGNAFADPTFAISSDDSGSDIVWTISVTPDMALDIGADGSSIAAELDFEVVGSTIMSLTNVMANFDTSNPGNNPNTGGVTNGIVVEANNTDAFASYGSVILTADGSAYDAFTLTTAGTGATTLNVNGLLAQEGQNFTGLSDSEMAGGGSACDLVAPAGCDVDDIDTLSGDDTATAAWLLAASAENGQTYLVGDANIDGDVDFDDFLDLAAVFPLASGGLWSQGNFEGNDGDVDFDDFLALAANYPFNAGSVSAVPEPSCFAMLASLVVMGLARRRS